MAFDLKQILPEMKFNIEFEENCIIYRRKIKTKLFGELWIDIFEGEGFDEKIEVVKDCEPVAIFELTVDNLVMIIEELRKLEVK